MYYAVLRSGRDLVQQTIKASKQRDWEEFNPSEFELSGFTFTGNEDLANPDLLTFKPSKQVIALTRESRTAPNFTFKLKIMLGFFQIVTNVAFLNDVPWPTVYQTFINWFSVLNLDFVPWQSVGCVASINYYHKFLIVACTPIGVTLLILLLFFVPLWLLQRTDLSDAQVIKTTRKLAVRKFWRLALFTVFLIYPRVSSTILGLFVCRSINGESFLVADFNLRCYDEQWYQYAPAGIIFAILYPLGIPLFFFYLLYSNRRTFHHPEVILQLGFLFEAYQYDMWWFEMVDMANKLLLTSILPFLPPTWQMQAGMFVCLGFILVMLVKAPYVRKGDDRLHLFAEVEIFLVAFCGWILLDSGAARLEETINWLLSVVLIALTVLLIVIFLLMSVRNIKKMWQRRIRKKNQLAVMEKRKEQLKLVKAARSNSIAGGEDDSGSPVTPNDGPAPVRLILKTEHPEEGGDRRSKKRPTRLAISNPLTEAAQVAAANPLHHSNAPPQDARNVERKQTLKTAELLGVIDDVERGGRRGSRSARTPHTPHTGDSTGQHSTGGGTKRDSGSSMAPGTPGTPVPEPEKEREAIITLSTLPESDKEPQSS